MSLLRISFIALGVLSFVAAIYAKSVSDEATWWHSTSGVVIHSFVDKVAPGLPFYSTSYYPIVRYNYNVSGKEYTGNIINIGTKAIPSKRYANEKIGKYPKDQVVKVYYDPLSPDQSVLERQVPGAVLVLLNMAGVLFVLLGIFFRKGVLHMSDSLTGYWRDKRYRHEK